MDNIRGTNMLNQGRIFNIYIFYQYIFEKAFAQCVVMLERVWNSGEIFLHLDLNTKLLETN